MIDWLQDHAGIVLLLSIIIGGFIWLACQKDPRDPMRPYR